MLDYFLETLNAQLDRAIYNRKLLFHSSFSVIYHWHQVVPVAWQSHQLPSVFDHLTAGCPCTACWRCNLFEA